MSEYIYKDGKVYKKKKKKQETDAPLLRYENGKLYKNKNADFTEIDIAPVRTTASTPKKKEYGDDGWFTKGAFRDDKGTAFTDTLLTVGATIGDAGLNIAKGILAPIEGLKDLAQYGVAGVSDLIGEDEYAEKVRKNARKESVENLFAPMQDGLLQYSALGDKSRSVASGVGQVGAIIGTAGLGALGGLGAVGTTALTTGVTGLSSMGSGMSEAYNEGASDEDALTYGAIQGLVDAGTEMIFGGLGKSVKALGLSKGLSSADDLLAKKISSKLSKQITKNFAEYGIKAGAEGFEEVLAGVGSALGKKVTYKSEEEIKTLIEDEDLLDQFLVGAITSGIAQSGYVPKMQQGSLREANKSGRDFITGFTQNEQKVIDKEFENRIKEQEVGDKKLTEREKTKIYDEVLRTFERGEIDTDTIDQVLNEEGKNAYDNLVKESEEFDTLFKTKKADLSREQELRLEELEKKNATKSYKDQLAESRQKYIDDARAKVTSNDRYIVESYNERAKRGQDFEADLTKYDSKQAEVVKRAMDSGILNNTRKTHDFVDMVAKVSAEKGVSFDFLNNQRLRESGFAIEGKTINGFKKGNTITVNMEARNNLNTVVGHEITHVLEGDPELYKALAEGVKAFGDAKGIYQEMYDTAFENYKNVYKDMSQEDYAKAIEKEVTADLVGEYIFSDIDFVRNLSTQNRNVFQKVYNEIKYFLKTVTAGSDAEKQLLKAKKIFEDVYREVDSANNVDTDAKFSLVGNENGIEVYETSEDVKKLSYSQRKAKLLDIMINEYAGRTAKFTKNGESYYALYDKSGVKKGVHGDLKSDKKGYKAKINIGADGNYIELAENSLYKSSSVEQGKENAFHKDAKSWDYYVKTIKSDGNYFDVLINVKDTGNDHYVYDVTLKEATLLPDQLRSYDGSSIAPNESVSQNSEKVNTEVQFSTSQDTEGKQLTPSQAEYFKDSKVRDENGNLKVLYHGTENYGFTVFETINDREYGSHFGSKESASEFSDDMYKVYLNIKNPINLPDIFGTCSKLADYVYLLHGQKEMMQEPLTNGMEGKPLVPINTKAELPMNEAFEDYSQSVDYWINYDGSEEGAVEVSEKAQEYLKSLGYDGVEYINEFEGKGSKSYMVFDSNQIKNVDNEHPTDNEDIRYSISKDTKQADSNYLKAVNEGDTETAQKMVDEVARANGYNTVVFHGTNADKINVFVGSPDRMETNAPNLIKGYFSDQESYSDDYGENTFKYYINTDDFLYIDSMFDTDEMTEYLEKHGVTGVEYNDFISDEDALTEWLDDYGDGVIDPWMFFNENGGNITERIREAGYKGVYWNEGYATEGDGMAYMPFESGLIKSAEAVTYDDNGNVIPLSERFNSENEDTRYSISDANQEIAPTPNGIYSKDVLLQSSDTQETLEENSTIDFAEDYAPIRKDIARTTEKYEAIRPEPVKGEPRMVRVKDAPMKSNEPSQVAKVLAEEPKVGKKKSRFLSQAMELVADKGFVFENLAKKTKNRELEAKWNSTRYAEGMAQDFIGNGEGNVRALNDVQKEVEKAGLKQELSEYLYHLHNIDRMNLADRYEGVENKPVFGDSVTSEVSRTEVAKLEAKNPTLKKYANEIYSINNHLRQMLVDGGVISQETADLWSEMYPHYVPIRRVGENGFDINVPLDTRKTGINAPVKMATGGSSDIMPLFDTMAQRTLQTYRAVARNKFGVELKNTLGTVVGTETTDLDGVMEGMGSQDELLQKGKNGSKPTFTVFEGGEKVTFEIDETMYDALKPTSEALTYTNPVTNAISNFHRNVLTQYNPVFTLRNIIKDTQDVLINSQHPMKTYAKYPKALAELSTHGKWFNEYVKNGGEQNTYFDKKSNTFVEDKSNFVKAIGMPLNAVTKANDFIERLPRLAEYIASRESGRSVEVSMLDSARVTTNFSAGGDLTKFLNRNGATFLNASIQGAMQQVRNVREAKMNGLKGWMQLATKCAIAGVPIYFLNAMLWDDDEEYEELSDYVKQNYYVVAKFGDGSFVRIPKGRTLSVIQNAFEQTANALTGKDEVDLESFTQLAITNLAPNNPFEDNILAPIVQVANNETWYGEDLVPTRLQDLPNEEQYDESTDDLSKWLGEVTGQSPYKINYLLEQYSGAIGDVFLPMITPEAESGDDSLKGQLIAPLRDAFTTDGVLNNQNISDFYDTVDELTKKANSSKATNEDVLASKYINSISSEIGKLYGEKREVQNSNLSNSEKYKRVREIQEEINALAKEGLNNYMDVNEESDWYATVGDRQYRWNQPDDEEGRWEKLTEEQIEKQDEVTSTLSISPSDYWSNKEEYDYAYKNPGKYSIAKATGGYDTYKSYMDELNDIRADKDSNGKSISGSAKAKKQAYIESLDLDYGQKIILHRSLYDSKTDKSRYNREIVEYLDSREDITWNEMVTILEELDFKVYEDGRITW